MKLYFKTLYRWWKIRKVIMQATAVCLVQDELMKLSFVEGLAFGRSNGKVQFTLYLYSKNFVSAKHIRKLGQALRHKHFRIVGVVLV